MAAMPSNQGSPAIDCRAGLDGAVEVVGDGQDLADEVLGGEAEVALALLGGPPLEVQELGALALEGGQVLVGLRLAAASRSAGQRLDLGDAGRVGEMSISSMRSWARVAVRRWLRHTRWSTSSFMRPDTKRTVPMAWG